MRVDGQTNALCSFVDAFVHVHVHMYVSFNAFVRNDGTGLWTIHSHVKCIYNLQRGLGYWSKICTYTARIDIGIFDSSWNNEGCSTTHMLVFQIHFDVLG
jgi:hypothetical protein